MSEGSSADDRAAGGAGAPAGAPRLRSARLPHTTDVRDAVYGMAHLSATSRALMRSTAEKGVNPLVRLGRVSQLSFVSHVYPGATGSRYAHAIGAAHMSLEMGKALHEHALRSRHPTDADGRVLTCLEIAGLCHDLGHGPFSHTFECAMNAGCAEGEEAFDHEAAGVLILEHVWSYDVGVVDARHLDNLHEPELRLIQSMILGRPVDAVTRKRTERTPWLLQVVHNVASGFDADRVDYLLRDAHFTGIPLSLDMARLLTKLSVTEEGNMGIKASEFRTLHNLFDARQQMHSIAYQHPIAVVGNVMFGAACSHSTLFAAARRQLIEDPLHVLLLDDDFLGRMAREDASPVARLIAHSLLNRRRWDYELFRDPEAAAAACEVAKGRGDVFARVHRRHIHFGSGAKDPLDAITFVDAGGRKVTMADRIDVTFARPTVFETFDYLVITVPPGDLVELLAAAAAPKIVQRS